MRAEYQAARAWVVCGAVCWAGVYVINVPIGLRLVVVLAAAWCLERVHRNDGGV